MIGRTKFLKKLIGISLIGTFSAICILVLQTIGNKYDDAIVFAWCWSIATLLPFLMILSFLFFQPSKSSRLPLNDKQSKVLIWMVVGYYILILITLLNVSKFSPTIKMLNLSYFWLVPFQLFIIFSFFIPFFKKQLETSVVEKNNENSSSLIFFSYAWGDQKEEGESREKIVDELYKSLDGDEFDVIRDKVDLGYGMSINEFMKKIGKGNLILVFISKKYFKSHFCMYELIEVARNSSFDKNTFAKRILPVPIEYIDFTKPQVLKEYFDYWENEKKEWTNFIQENFEQATTEQYNRYEKTKHIHQYFGRISDWLADLNQMSTPLLSKNNFKLMKDTISNRLKSQSGNPS